MGTFGLIDRFFLAAILKMLSVFSLDEILACFSQRLFFFFKSVLSLRIRATVLQAEQDGTFQCHSPVSQIVTKGSPSLSGSGGGKEGGSQQGRSLQHLMIWVLKGKNGKEQEIGLKSPPNQ